VSKAFTDEESQDPTVLGRKPVRVARGAERPITPEGYRALVAKVEALGRERAEAQTLPEPARAQRLADVEHRLAVASATVESVRVVEPQPPDGTVRFGSEVTLEWDDGRTQRLVLVGPDEAEPKSGRISVEAPLARSLLGLARGDSVEVERPKGVETATITEVT
jgi:transcription elongation factor GreB